MLMIQFKGGTDGLYSIQIKSLPITNNKAWSSKCKGTSLEDVHFICRPYNFKFLVTLILFMLAMHFTA